VLSNSPSAVNLLREIEVGVANGTMAQACKKAEIVEQTYFRWRKEYGGLQVDQPKRLKELEQENAKLKWLRAELSLDKLVLKGIAAGNVHALKRRRCSVSHACEHGSQPTAVCLLPGYRSTGWRHGDEGSAGTHTFR
jgi:putative transposase